MASSAAFVLSDAKQDLEGAATWIEDELGFGGVSASQKSKMQLDEEKVEKLTEHEEKANWLTSGFRRA